MSRAGQVDIFPVGQRLQHALFGVALALALVTGAGSPWLIRLAGGPVTLHARHALFGGLVAVALLVHLLYLSVRSYAEGLAPSEFPLRLGKGDARRIVAGIFGAGEPGVRYTATRRLAYWVFVWGALVEVLSGAAVRYWDFWDLGLVTGSLGFLSALHAGTGMILGLAIPWHLLDILGGGRMSLALTAVNGRIGRDRLAAWYADEHARIVGEERRRDEQERLAVGLTGEPGDDAALQQQRWGVELLLEEGNRAAREGDLAGSEERFRRALEIFPAYSQARFNLAVVLEKEGKLDEAVEAYREFLKIDPFHPLSRKAQDAVKRLMGSVL